MGNSGYCKTITNQLKQWNVKYCSDAEASRKVNNPLFRKLDNITEDNYQVESCKKTIKLNLPIQVSFLCISMLSYACCSFIMIFLTSILIAAIFKCVKWMRIQRISLFLGRVWEVKSNKNWKQSSKPINVTGFPVRIHPSIKPMISEPRVFLRLSGRDKELSGCVQKPSNVLGPKISFLSRSWQEM